MVNCKSESDYFKILILDIPDFYEQQFLKDISAKIYTRRFRMRFFRPDHILLRVFRTAVYINKTY